MNYWNLGWKIMVDILIVEDDNSTRRLLERILNR